MKEPSSTPLSPVKRALLKIEALRRELDAVRQAAVEPIAVVGMGCRLPGGSDSAQALWQMLAAGTDAVTEVPADRWSDALYDPRPGQADTSYCRHGAFIDGVDRFDAEFFGVSGREARRLDPQQRLLLECTWRALEDAGFTATALQGSKTGVFVGSSLDDYARLSEVTPGAERSFAQTSLGTARPFAAGRIAYLFGWHGPTLQLDTACSSSLVTTHLACQSLRQRECDVAFSGGVNLMLSPEMTIALCELQALSPGGRCATFDAAADGYVRGEGCGVVALMRLSDAQAQGRPIRAVIRGSAVNHDGRSNGMTAPNGRAQRAVIREALERAGITPAQVDYVEAHGTGTALGDPIELRALHDVYCSGVERAQDLYVGSIKTNIGHLEGAASVAALIKVVCSLQHGELPRHLHFDTPTPHIDWARSRLRVPQQHMAWPQGQSQRRVAAISAFGMSGTNAHLIVEAHEPAPAPALPAAAVAQAEILALSAHTPTALHQAVADCVALLEREDAPALADLAHTLRLGRDHRRCRVAVVAADVAQARARMRALLAAQQAPAPATPVAGTQPGAVAFMFSGQGAQYAGMARRLYQTAPLFRRTIDECDTHVEALTGHSLVDVLWGEEQALVDDTRFTQPALFAVELGLARLWSSWGVHPEVLIGHSVGEYAAACFGGVFSVEDGVRLVVARGRLMHELTPPGRMSAVLASAQQLAPLLAQAGGEVELAGDNAPASVVIAGSAEAHDALVAQLARQGVQTRALPVSRAFHSPLMAPMLEAFRAVAATVRYQAPRLRIVSNLSAGVESARLCDPGYWVEHVRRTVRFREGVHALLAQGVRLGIEVGPGKALASLARAAAQPQGAGLACVHSIDTHHDERTSLFEAVAAVQARGVDIDWTAFDAAFESLRAPQRVALPPQPLEPASYWVGPRQAAHAGRVLDSAGWRPAAADAGLLGEELQSPGMTERRFERRFTLRELPFLRGHGLGAQALFPAAGYLAIALEAALRLQPGEELRLSDVSFDVPLALPADTALRLASVVSRDGQGRARMEMHARAEGAAEWVCHASARLDGPALAPLALDEPCTLALDAAALYDRLQHAGLRYEGGFRALGALRRGPRRAAGHIGAEAHATGHTPVIHPMVLDNALQLIAAALWEEAPDRVFLPMGVGRMAWYRTAAVQPVHGVVRITAREPVLRADVEIHDAHGTALARLYDVTLAPVEPRQLNAAAGPFVQALQWQPWDAAAAPQPPQRWLVAGADAAWRQALGQPDAGGSTPQFLAAAQPQPAAAAHWEQVLADCAATPESAPSTLLYCWPAASASQAPDALPRSVAQAYQAFAEFWRALQATRWPGQVPRVVVLTRGAQALSTDEALAPDQAAAWGLVRSLMHEAPSPSLWLADLPCGAGATATPALWRGLNTGPGQERQFLLRGDTVHVPRVVERRAPSAPASLAHGAYLVTGGRGALGTQLTEWLLAQRVARVVSVSRGAPAPAERQRLLALAAQAGTQLDFEALDIADAAAVAALVAALQADVERPLKGVFHAAGVLEDGLLLLQDAAAAQRVLAPKVLGGWALHQATAGLALDHFVAFSSITACLGAPGQCAYGAANAFLDALCLQRNRQGLAGHSVNWGLWGGAGMAAQLGEAQRRRIAATGLREIDPAQALRTLAALLAQPQGQSLVWQAELPVLLARNTAPAVQALLSRLAPPSGAGMGAPAQEHTGLAQLLQETPVAEREMLLVRQLAQRLATTLQVDAARMDIDAPLIQLGLDSLMAGEFRAGIRRELGVEIAFGRLLEGATLRDVVRTVVAGMDLPQDDSNNAAAGKAAMAALLDAVSTEATFGVELEAGEL